MSADAVRYHATITRLSSGQFRADVVGLIGRVARRYYAAGQERAARDWGARQAATFEREHAAFAGAIRRARAAAG